MFLNKNVGAYIHIYAGTQKSVWLGLDHVNKARKSSSHLLEPIVKLTSFFKRAWPAAPRATAAVSGQQNTDFINSLFDSTDGTSLVPVTTFADVGGYTKQLKAILKLCKHLADPSVLCDYTRLRVRPPCGLLLYGSPGCGKSLVARAIAGVSWDVLLNYLRAVAPKDSGSNGKNFSK